MPDTAAEVWVMFGDEPVRAGHLWSHRRGRKESATFAYGPDYLGRPDAYALDPVLPLLDGQQQTTAGRPLFGAFEDSAPDRWGERLIRRAAEAGRGDGTRNLGEIDFLLGVGDDMRQGALRYRDPDTRAFLAVEEEAVPPLLALPELLGAADRLERDEADEEQLRILLRGGSSLGGARPKANVLMPDAGGVRIAKFPSVKDDHDVIRWEAVAMTLARAAGIEVADFELRTVAGRPVLLIDRFDRVGGLRIGYVSAMTMLEANDGEASSYPEIAEVIETISSQASQDARELWRRIAFTILISNTDDHLRNHGFLRRSTAGWDLSPAFDLNPDPEPGPKHLRTAVTFGDDRASIENLISVRDYFRLGADEAEEILAAVRAAVARWASVAQTTGLRPSDIEAMAPAFEAARS